MFLLLGDPSDPCCSAVHDALHMRNHDVQMISYPLAHPQRTSWWLETDRTQSQLLLADGTRLSNTEIEGVLVRDTWIDTHGWQADDLLYMQAEAQAALLGWLWSLECPVINRYPADIWNRRHIPLPLWGPALRRCGLAPIKQLISTDAEDLAAFGIDSATYAPLTDPARYQLTPEAITGLAKLGQYTPVCLLPAFSQPLHGCVAGDAVIWQEPLNNPELDRAVADFARQIGLPFLEIEIATTAAGLEVIDVLPFPDIRRFSTEQQQAIAGHLADTLVAEGSLR